MFKRILTTAAIGVTVLAAATGTAAALIGQPAGSSPASAAPPTDAALVTPTFGWVLSADGLRVTRDGGATFTDANVPLPAGQARAAEFLDARDGVVAVADGNVINVARTTDGGATWATSKMSDPDVPSGFGYSNLKVAFGSPDRGVVMARVRTGVNFSIGALYATTDAGASWTAHPAPVAGDVSMESTGRVWLAGGVLHDQLYRSDDTGANWTQAKVSVAPDRQLGAVSLPAAGRLSATVLNSDKTEVELLSSADQGQSWSPSSSVALVGKTGMGVAIPVGQTADGPLVLDNAGGHAYRFGKGSDIAPRGLPEGVVRTTFAPGGVSGWALATHGQCKNGKQDCTLYHELVSTSDGGATWKQVQVWAQPIG